MYTKEERNELEQAVQGIIKDLAKAENIDLRMAVAQVTNEGGNNGTFMFGFTQRNPLTFDDFAMLAHETDTNLSELLSEDLRSMSARYDEYLEILETDNEEVTLGEDQTARWKAIVEQFNTNWSGAVYGIVCREVQRRLKSGK